MTASSANSTASFSLKPVFVGWITLAVQLPFQLFLTIWAGGFFGAMAMSIGLFPDSSSASFFLFGGLAFFGVPILTYFGRKLNYARTEYLFFNDRVEFEEGFFTISKKVVNFRDVLEVTLRKGVLQRFCGLGSVYLATLATGSSPRGNPFGMLGFGNVSASGITIRYVRDPDAAYRASACWSTRQLAPPVRVKKRRSTASGARAP